MTYPDVRSVWTVHEGALGGLRVLDLSRILSGPFCTMTLADLGADMIKVEDTRYWIAEARASAELPAGLVRSLTLTPAAVNQIAAERRPPTSAPLSRTSATTCDRRNQPGIRGDCSSPTLNDV